MEEEEPTFSKPTFSKPTFSESLQREEEVPVEELPVEHVVEELPVVEEEPTTISVVEEELPPKVPNVDTYGLLDGKYLIKY